VTQVGELIPGVFGARPLSPFEGRDVVAAAIEIPGAAGGLREAMKFVPGELQHDDEVYVVLHCRVKKVRFDEIKDDEGLTRVHVFDVDSAALVDGGLVRDHLDAQNERIRLAKEQAEGIQRLGLDPGEMAEAEALEQQHKAGVHADGLRDGCPACEEEKAAYEAEGQD
jgi:hypothetical protein